MSRAPFSYPLMRAADAEAGGAADLSSDVMRFMAILALCLMAIFALVQSLPATPGNEAVPLASVSALPDPVSEPEPQPQPQPAPDPEPEPGPPEPRLVANAPAPVAAPPPAAATPTPAEPAPSPSPVGFTLRFESDRALSRLVATGQVGLFAIGSTGAQRMSVASSRVSFWSTPIPRRFHEMDAATVPRAVKDALARSGRAGDTTRWAVTLPTRLKNELDRILREHEGGALIIAMDGSLRREAS
jgi:outer membrane biosynthesis protein TonB